MKWNLRWVAARRDIWRPSQLNTAFEEVGFTPSLSKVAALWSGKPVTVRLEDLDKICAALQCTVADLMEAEPIAADETGRRGEQQTVGENPRAGSGSRPVPKRTGGPGGVRRLLPPN
ncbi:helix-turn-helix domain-containing protein [Streptomyces diastatochromogenes]|uniref:helix-turn-helix domain-containing protein n=1 Tax=Streptomyces diastatochromogenes TaxID=42236 RepID=UPI0036A87D20